MSNDEIILGIDLGTTFSMAAYVDNQGHPRVIRNAEGEKATPSVVLVEGGQIQVGAAAANQAIVKRDNVIQWVKRSMGSLDYRFQGLSPIEISAEILKKINADSKAELGVALRKAVITCPAYFSAVEVESTMKAGQLAGFEVQEIVREPMAAAVYYGVEHLQEGNKLLVCDLGGGTYDASILTLENGTFKPLATSGDRQLGGHDWTMDLLEHVAERLAEILGEDPRNDSATAQMLYDTCERVKRSFAHSDHGMIPCVFKDQTAQVAVSRSDFEQMTEWRIQQVMMWTENALAKTDPPLTWDQIDQILLVGGATRMRRVPEAIEEISGKKPIQIAEADTMVVMGAAILAKGVYRPRRVVAGSGIKKSIVSGLTLINFTRTASRNLGTRVIVRDGPGLSIRNSAIIPYGTELPSTKTFEMHASTGGQTFFDIPVVEFDDVGPDVILGVWRFDCLPGLPQEIPIHVTFRYDQSGQVDVEAVEYRTHTLLAKKLIPYEEPALQAPAQIALPRAIVFAVDVSDSMDEHQGINRAKQIILDQARGLLATSDRQIQIGIVAFGSQAATICPLTSDLHIIAAALSRVSVHGTTAMDAGITLATDMLFRADPGRRREIVLISGSLPDKPHETLAAGAQARAQDVMLCTVCIGRSETNEAFLQELAPYLLVTEESDRALALGNLLTLATSQVGGISWLGGSVPLIDALAPSKRIIASLQRFTDVRFPEQCKIQQHVRLSVQLTLKPVDIEIHVPVGMPRPLPPVRVSVEPIPREIEKQQVELIVSISAENFEIDKQWQRLKVPFDQDSEKIEFSLIGQKLGQQIIEVELFHGSARVGYVVVETQIVEGETVGRDAQVIYETIDERGLSGTPAQPAVTLIVNWRESKGIYYGVIEKNARQMDAAGFVPIPRGEKAVMGFWDSLTSMLGELVQLSDLSEDKLESVWLNVEGWGQALCEQLLSAELQGYSFAWPVGSIIVIDTNDRWIPWELIHDGDDFWGNKFILARRPRIPDRTAFSPSDKAVERYASRQLGKAVNIIGGELKPPQIIERARRLFATLRANIPIEDLERATLAQVFHSIADAGLVHFTCHGHASPQPYLQLADDQSLTCCLTPFNLKALPHIPDSIIFANACTSAAVTSFLGELRNFGWEFYKKGASAYIGTLGLVPTEYAVAFAEQFYAKLLSGFTIGESLHYAKSQAERENPFWLLYTLYGDPFARKYVLEQ